MGAKGKIGLIGLAVMGANLARNLAGHGISTVVYNRSHDKTENFLKEFGSDTNLSGAAALLWPSAPLPQLSGGGLTCPVLPENALLYQR